MEDLKKLEEGNEARFRLMFAENLKEKLLPYITKGKCELLPDITKGK